MFVCKSTVLFFRFFDAAEGPAERVGNEETATERHSKEEAPTVSDGNEKQEGTKEKKMEEKGGGKPTIFQDSSEEVADVTAPKVLQQMQVLRHLPEGRSPNFSLLHFIIVVPLSKTKAEEALKDGWVIDEQNVEQLRKQVDRLSK